VDQPGDNNGGGALALTLLHIERFLTAMRRITSLFH
jgi:hypothetical protein